jgi:hypothetical protein
MGIALLAPFEIKCTGTKCGRASAHEHWKAFPGKSGLGKTDFIVCPDCGTKNELYKHPQREIIEKMIPEGDIT